MCVCVFPECPAKKYGISLPSRGLSKTESLGDLRVCTTNIDLELDRLHIHKQPVAPFSVRAFCTISSSSGPLQVYFVCISCGKNQVFLCSMHKMMWKLGCVFGKNHISLVFSSNFDRELCEI